MKEVQKAVGIADREAWKEDRQTTYRKYHSILYANSLILVCKVLLSQRLPV
jgi:hypothetical protein